eukprot:g1785.t1
MARPVPRMVACDLDGTLLRGGNGVYSDAISPRTVQAIRAYEERGGAFVIATGNGWDVTHKWRVAGGIRTDFAVCSDGMSVYDGRGRLLAGRQEPVRALGAVLAPVLRALRPATCGWHVYTDPPAAYFSAQWVRVRVFADLAGSAAGGEALEADFRARGWDVRVAGAGSSSGAAGAHAPAEAAEAALALLGGAPAGQTACGVYVFERGGGSGAGAGAALRALQAALPAAGATAVGWSATAQPHFFVPGASLLRAPLRGAAACEDANEGADEGADEDADAGGEEDPDGKHAGLRLVASRLGVRRRDVMALGDGRNDVTMLRWAGWGAAPANARDASVRAAADEVLPWSNNEDAVARVLEDIVGKMDEVPTPGRSAE